MQLRISRTSPGGWPVALVRSAAAAAAVALALLAPTPSWAEEEPVDPAIQPESAPAAPPPAPLASVPPVQPTAPSPVPTGDTDVGEGEDQAPPLELIGPDKGKKSTSSPAQQQAMAAAIAKEQAQEAARQAVAEARIKLEKVRAKHRLNKVEISRLVAKSERAGRQAARARREMGNMARAAYTSGDNDLNLLATLLAAQSPQEVLGGAGTAARLASHKEQEWQDAIRLQDKANRLAVAAEALLDKSAVRLDKAKAGLAAAISLAEGVDLAIEPPAKVPPVDLTTKSDWVFPSATGQIDSEAGMRMHPILRFVRCHAGADISAPSGTPIYAVDDGVVLTAGVNGGYGNFTLIAHGGGLTSGYAHQQLILVKPGDRVERGQLIGEVGSTGLSTGAHLHFEASYHGVAYNPRGWLEDKPQLRVPAC